MGLPGQRVCAFLEATDNILPKCFSCQLWTNVHFHQQLREPDPHYVLIVSNPIFKKLVNFVYKNGISLGFYFTVLTAMVTILSKLFMSNSSVNCLRLLIFTKKADGRPYKSEPCHMQNHPSHVIRIHLPDTGHNAVLSPDAYSSSNRSQNHKDSRQESFPEDCKHKLY